MNNWNHDGPKFKHPKLMLTVYFLLVLGLPMAVMLWSLAT